jgi:putative oxidoreductase
MIEMNHHLERARQLCVRLEHGAFFPALLVRLYLGYFFFETGIGKVQNLDVMTERFLEWGIPFPAFNAALSGYTELFGGALLLLGLATRAVCVPLFINMVVATVSVKLAAVSSLSDFVELDEPLYALSFLWLFFQGPGRISLDHLLWGLLRRPRRLTAVAA